MQKAHLNKHLCLVPCKIKGKTLGRSTKMPRLHEKKKDNRVQIFTFLLVSFHLEM